MIFFFFSLNNKQNKSNKIKSLNYIHIFKKCLSFYCLVIFNYNRLREGEIEKSEEKIK
jgi:hypothetical protein